MQITKQTFSNGLRAVHVAATDAQSVTIMFLVAVGGRHELDNEAGLAHFVEHTLFKGTPTRPSSKVISMEIESLGANTNAFTSNEYTGYYIKTPSENFHQAAAILADLFQNPLFPEKEIKLESGVIVEEIRMYDDRPTSKVVQEWSQNFFGTNNLGKDLAGTVESVKGMQRQQFVDFIKKHYYAENCLVIVSGNVDWQTVEREITTLTANLPTRAQAQQGLSSYQSFDIVQAPNRKQKIVVRKDLEQAHIILGGAALNNDDPRRFALQVANTILGGGFGSKLMQVLREELGLAYYVYSHISGFRDTGIYQIGMGVDQTRINEALEAVNRQLAELREGAFSEADFTRAKNFLLGGLTIELETSDDIAMYYGMQELLQKEQLEIVQVKQLIQAVSRDDVLTIAKEIFADNNQYLAVLSKDYE